jgi:hypothetical protein
MSNNWIAGSGQALTMGVAFNATDITTSLPTNGQSVLSTVTIANQTALDKLCDLSISLTIASSTIVAGANIAFWIAELAADNTIYGDGQLTAGTVATLTPAWAPVGVIPLFAAAARTTLIGTLQGIVIPPRSFKFIFQNNSGFTLTNTTTLIDYITYNP